MRKNEIIIPIFNDEYKVIVCWGDSKQIEKILQSWHYPKENISSSLLDRRGVCFYHNSCHPVIALPQYPKTAEQIGTLAHEAVHAIDDIFMKINEQPTRGEIFAHAVGAVVRTVLNKKYDKNSKHLH